MNSTLQLPIISTIHEIKKPLRGGDKLKTCRLLKRKGLITHNWSRD